MSSKGKIEEITDPYKLREIGLTHANKYFDFVGQPIMFKRGKDPHRVWDLAVTCFRRLTTILPDFHFDWYQLGMLYQEEKRYSSAIECFEKALEIKPNFAKAYIGLGLICFKNGEIEKAHDYFWKAVVLNPKYSAGWGFLGSTYRDEDLEIACYIKALVINPKSFARIGLQGALLGKQWKSPY